MEKSIKILHSADWHILLHKKKVPYQWQINRFKLFFQKLLQLETTHDIHFISGDLFDKKPEPDEVCLLLEYLNSVTIPTYIIPGNHEATKKGESFLEHFISHKAISNPNVHIITKNSRMEFDYLGIQFFPYGEMQIDNLPIYHKNDILITHIRGEVPPHISAEYDFDKLSSWHLILLGDLHFHHNYKNKNIWYSGSPVNVSFDRNEEKEYGVNSITYNEDHTFQVTFLNLKLPKLIRKTIKAGEPMIADKVNHVVYEVTGSLDQLSKVVNTELLDKKLAFKATDDSQLNLKNMTLIQELELYLKHIKIIDTDSIIKEFKGLGL